MNVKDLRDSLIESFKDLKVGKLKTKEAKELTNLAGKIILSAKTELDYNKFMKKEIQIDFLEVEDAKPVESVKSRSKVGFKLPKTVRIKKPGRPKKI